MRQLLLLLSVAGVAQTTVFVSDQSNVASPYYAEYSRIDWDLCVTGGEKDAFCLMSDQCTMKNQLPTLFNDFAKDLLLKPEKPTDDYIGCAHGIMIKPSSVSRWVFFVQFFARNIDQRQGIKLLLKGYPSDVVLGHCSWDKEWQPVFKATSFTELKPTFTIASKKHDGTFSDTEDKMVCIFTIEASAGGNVAAIFGEIMKEKPELKKSQLWVEVTRRSTGKVTSVGSKMKWENIVNGVDARSQSMLTSISMPKELTEAPKWKREFDFSPVITDFSSLACNSLLARLVIFRNGHLHEVMANFIKSEQKTYHIRYIDEGGKDTEIYEKLDTPLSMACVIRTCLLCDPPPMVEFCEGCTKPRVIYRNNFRDCPQLKCRGDTWLFNDTLQVISQHEPSLTCMRDDAGVHGWFRPSNGHGVEAASCDEYNLDCALVSPLKDACAAGDASCTKLKIGKEFAYCPPGKATELKYEVDGEWKKLNTPLHCCHRMGTWYLGNQRHIDFNHSVHSLKCEVVSVPWLDIDDPLTFNVLLYTYAALVACFLFFLSLRFYDKYVCEKFARKRQTERETKDRPLGPETPEISDILSLRDIARMSDDDFWQIITDFQLYSADERVLFVDHILDELGDRVDIDHYLALFQHCSMMETDHRVWKKLVVGYKMILIAFNQVNKTREGMALNEGLKMCMHQVLNRIGYNMTEGEDESVTETRNIALGVQLSTACRHTRSIMLTEAALTRGREDIRRRRQLFAYRARAGNLQDSFKTKWETIARFRETDKWYLKMIREEKKQAAKLDVKKKTKKEKKGDRGRLIDVEKLPWGQEPPMTLEERAQIKELHEQAKKWGSWREHMLYAICSGKNPEYVKQIFGEILTENKDKSFSPREIVSAFRAAVEDCFDMRWAAKSIFFQMHSMIKRKVPVASEEYKEIFVMFGRYFSIDASEEENLLTKHLLKQDSYEGGEAKQLPLAQIGKWIENGRLLLEMAKTYQPPTEVPGVGEEEESEKEDETLWISKNPKKKKKSAATTKQQTTKSEPTQGSKSASKSQNSGGTTKSQPGSGTLSTCPGAPGSNSGTGTEKKSEPKAAKK